MWPSTLLPVVLCTSLVASWSWADDAMDYAALMAGPHKRSPQVETLGNTNAPPANPTQTFAAAAATSDASASQATSDSKSSASNAKSTDSSAGTTTDSDSAASSTGNSAATSGGSSGSSGQSSGSTKTTGGGKSSGKSTATSSKVTDIDPRLPAGGLSMITPNALSSTQYYRIGNYITFAWNYTSLSVTPSAIDILASCSANQATYTLALNQSISGPTGAVTWDTGDYQATATQQLLTETYTLVIYDAAQSVSSTPSAGYLGTFDQFTFGMYVPQQYTPLNDWVCATCNGAVTTMEKQTLMFLGVMAAICTIAFTSFLGGAGLLF